MVQKTSYFYSLLLLFLMAPLTPSWGEWHGVDLAEFAPNQFLVVWSYRGAGTDDFALRGGLLDASESDPRIHSYFTINDAEEAQEPPVVVFDPNTQRFLVVWEDGRRYDVSEVDIRAALLDVNGTVLSNDIEVDLGDAAQHGPALVRSGTTAMVAYIDERMYSTQAADPVLGILDFQGNVLGSYLPVAFRPDDEWWPILSAGKTRVLMGWFNGENDTVSGALLTPDGTVDRLLVLLTNAFAYEYASEWLPSLERFIVVARSGSGSRAVLVDESGNLSGLVSSGLPQIVRESHLAVQQMPDGKEVVLYCTTDGGIAVLDVSPGSIVMRDQIPNVFPWTTKGTDGTFVGLDRAVFLATSGTGGIPTAITVNLTPASNSRWNLY